MSVMFPRVQGELIESRGDGNLVQPSTVVVRKNEKRR
jgi:hypothetical protein